MELEEEEKRLEPVFITSMAVAFAQLSVQSGASLFEVLAGLRLADRRLKDLAIREYGMTESSLAVVDAAVAEIVAGPKPRPNASGGAA